MERLGEFDNKVIIEQYNEPENKNVIWKDPDENKYKEYVDGSWVESEKIATPGGGGEITPEQITPEILDDETFRERLLLYGHTIEEVEQMIQNGKCIQCKSGVEDKEVTREEDFLYCFNETPFLLMNDEPFNSIDIDDVEYIYISSGEISTGLLLKYIEPYFYRDVLNTFTISFDENGDFSGANIGYDSF